MVEINVTRQVLEQSDTPENLSDDLVLRTDVTVKKCGGNRSFLRRENVGSHVCTIAEQGLNRLSDYNSTRQVCVSDNEAKNLVAEHPINVESAGATEQTESNLKEIIFQFTWWMKKQGYAKTTIIF